MRIWQDKFGITTIESTQKYENYFYKNGKLTITSDDNDEQIVNKTFKLGLRGTQAHESAGLLIRYFEYLEKAYLLEMITPIYKDIEKFIKPEGTSAKIVTRKTLEDAHYEKLDKQLKTAVKGKDIYFFNRMRINIITREGWWPGDVTMLARSRFNFLVFDSRKPDGQT